MTIRLQFQKNAMGCPDGFTQKTYHAGCAYDFQESDKAYYNGFLTSGVATIDGDVVTHDENGDGQIAINEMSVKDLKAYAEENDIDLNGVTKKADILEAIKAAQSAPAKGESEGDTEGDGEGA